MQYLLYPAKKTSQPAEIKRLKLDPDTNEFRLVFGGGAPEKTEIAFADPDSWVPLAGRMYLLVQEDERFCKASDCLSGTQTSHAR